MFAGFFGEFVEVDGDQLCIVAVVDLLAFTQAFEVVVDFPELGHQRVIGANCRLALKGHRHQLLLSGSQLVFIQRANQAQAIKQGQHLAVVFDDSLDADFFEFAQAFFVHDHALGKFSHHLWLCSYGFQQKVAQQLDRDLVQVVSGNAALCGHRRACKVQFDDTGQDRFGGADSSVLADGNGGAKRWFIGLVTAGFHAFRAQGAAAEKFLQFVPINLLSKTFIPHRLLSRAAFEQFALDFLSLGNGYIEARRSMLGSTFQLKPALAKYMRAGQDGLYFLVQGWKEEHEFHAGSIFHLREADLHQEVYGLPEWISALQSALLNESATLFRRKYYENGSHAGFILYMTDPAQNESDVDALRKALKDSKGPGNFRNLFVYSPNGKKDGIQLIPVSEVAAKDEFSSIKNQTRDDVLASLRIPPQLMGIVPQNAGGFGSIREAAQIYVANELEPIQSRMTQLNDWLGEEVVRFKPYEIAGGE